MSLGLYVGSFDPITLGHIDIIRQALLVFDKVHVGIGINPKKINSSMFSLDEREEIIVMSAEESGIDLERLSVGSYYGSMMQEARDRNAGGIIRGLRQISDFGDEFTINGMVARAIPDIPMTYFICRQDFLHVSSSSVKEMAYLKEDYSWMVTPTVATRIQREFDLKEREPLG